MRHQPLLLAALAPLAACGAPDADAESAPTGTLSEPLLTGGDWGASVPAARREGSVADRQLAHFASSLEWPNLECTVTSLVDGWLMASLDCLVPQFDSDGRPVFVVNTPSGGITEYRDYYVLPNNLEPQGFAFFPPSEYYPRTGLDGYLDAVNPYYSQRVGDERVFSRLETTTIEETAIKREAMFCMPHTDPGPNGYQAIQRVTAGAQTGLIRGGSGTVRADHPANIGALCMQVQNVDPFGNDWRGRIVGYISAMGTDSKGLISAQVSDWEPARRSFLSFKQDYDAGCQHRICSAAFKHVGLD